MPNRIFGTHTSIWPTTSRLIRLSLCRFISTRVGMPSWSRKTWSMDHADAPISPVEIDCSRFTNTQRLGVRGSTWSPTRSSGKRERRRWKSSSDANWPGSMATSESSPRNKNTPERSAICLCPTAFPSSRAGHQLQPARQWPGRAVFYYSHRHWAGERQHGPRRSVTGRPIP